jgi:hypothetical protein
VSLLEYLDVWCADLLDPLTAAQRDQVLDIVAASYSSAPLPPRLLIQRIAELSTGVITPDAFTAEITARYGYQIDNLIAALSSDDSKDRETAKTLLSRYPDTTELITKLAPAHAAGRLTHCEFSDICSAALRHPTLPEPIPLPAHLPPIPDN